MIVGHRIAEIKNMPSAKTEGSFSGMSGAEALRLLATEIEVVNPPVRPWSWIADWLQSQGIVGKDGGPLQSTYLQAMMLAIRKGSLVDQKKAESLRMRLLKSSFTGEDIGLVIKKAVDPQGNGGWLAEAKENLLRRGALEVRGMTVRQALSRLSYSVAVIKPLRSWSWIADWLIQEGVVSEDGRSPITGTTVASSWVRGMADFKANGLDVAMAEAVCNRIRGDLLSEKEIREILRGQSSQGQAKANGLVDGEDAKLLRDALGTVKGMSRSQALLRLSKSVAVIKPPIRSWPWIADWMQSQGVDNGEAIPPRSLAIKWSKLKSLGLIDESHADKMRERILDKPMSDKEVFGILLGKIPAQPAKKAPAGAAYVPESDLLSPWLESVEGLYISKACERLGNAIALVRPPIRSWEWIAGWMDRQEVKNRKGGDVNPTRVKTIYREMVEDGRIDLSISATARKKLLGSPISDTQLEEILARQIGPARLDRLRDEPAPKPPGPRQGKPKV